jgi:hypothetical protein
MGIASLAQLLTAGIAFMLIADVVVLPAILVLFDPRLPTGEPVRKAMVQAQGIAADEGPSGAVRSMR